MTFNYEQCAQEPQEETILCLLTVRIDFNLIDQNGG